MKVNPFNQPAVENVKILTKKILTFEFLYKDEQSKKSK